LASDLSADGIWIESKVALEPGDELLLSFVPPGRRARVWAAARVVRVGAREDQPSGMGLSFTFMSEVERAVLSRALDGMPPHLPHARVPPALPHSRSLRGEASRASSDALDLSRC
jgi:hypothetical protein